MAGLLETFFGKTKLQQMATNLAKIKELWLPGDDGALKKVTATADDLNSTPRDRLAGGFSKTTVADGTASATDVTVTGMVVGDELVKVLAFTTKAAIATMADRTSEYTVGAGKIVKAAGTNETNNQLLIFWNDLT